MATSEVTVTQETLTNRLYSPLLKQGTCIANSGECRVSQPYILVFPKNLTTSCDPIQKKISFRATGTLNQTILHDVSNNLQYPVMGGCYLENCGKPLLSLPSGHIFRIYYGEQYPFLPKCDQRTFRLPTRVELPPKLEPTLDEILEKYDKCLIKRQVIRNALTTGVPLDVQLLQEFNTDPSMGRTHKMFYVVANNQLLGASCPEFLYNGLEWRNHDVWAVKRGGLNVACLDARLGVIFQGMCRPYNSTQAWRALGMWNFFNSSGSMIARKEEYSTLNLVSTVTGVWFSNQAVEDVFTGSSSTVVEDPRYTNSPSDPISQNKGWELQWPSLLGGLGSIFGIIVVIVIIVLLWRCVGCQQRITRSYVSLPPSNMQ